ncbi:MAG TPA: hypothetical protein VLS25_01365 [Dehalococcoidia bacterium]|nr:hypothetical protein [Dehalococcoidia bacterium]
MIDLGPLPPPVTLGPYVVEFLGRRRGLRALRIRVGKHTLELFATLDGCAARVVAEIDGWRLVRRRKPRPWRRWSNDLVVKRWVLAAAAEFDDGVPRWSCNAIAQNLKRARRGEMSSEAVQRLIWRLSPALGERRAHYWRVEQWKKGVRKTKLKDAKARAAERQAVIAELKRAGLL